MKLLELLLPHFFVSEAQAAAGALFPPALFVAAFFAARNASQRLRVASAIARRPFALIFLFVFTGSCAAAGCSVDSPLIFAHRALCEAAILKRASLDLLCLRRPRGSDVAADCAPVPSSNARSSAI